LKHYNHKNYNHFEIEPRPKKLNRKIIFCCTRESIVCKFVIILIVFFLDYQMEKTIERPENLFFFVKPIFTKFNKKELLV